MKSYHECHLLCVLYSLKHDEQQIAAFYNETVSYSNERNISHKVISVTVIFSMLFEYKKLVHTHECNLFLSVSSG